jgi:hypothetical protein
MFAIRQRLRTAFSPLGCAAVRWLIRRDAWFRAVVGAVLLLASIAKLWSMWRGVPSIGGGAPGLLDVLAVQTESGVAIWLWLGVSRRHLWFATLLLHAIFAAVSLAKILNGNESCGCFGSFAVSPSLVLSYDVAIIACLALLRRHWWQHVHQRDSGTEKLGVLFLIPLAIGLLSALTVSAPVQLSSGERVVPSDGRTFVVRPVDWQGSPCPLLPFIEDQEVQRAVSVGNCAILLYAAQCMKCRKAQARFEELAVLDISRNYALIEIPPLEQSQPDSRRRCLVGNLSPRHHWLVHAPIAIFLSDGVVVGYDDMPDVSPESVRR